MNSVFPSYSHKDEAIRDQLETHLSMLPGRFALRRGRWMTQSHDYLLDIRLFLPYQVLSISSIAAAIRRSRVRSWRGGIRRPRSGRSHVRMAIRSLCPSRAGPPPSHLANCGTRGLHYETVLGCNRNTWPLARHAQCLASAINLQIGRAACDFHFV
jgi:hypothetical protein